ncbi:glycosyltransferase [Salinarimonas chemoclinalis]|uniref:glycosyltransferase n=1 Tax=Salinarimonas chemoclinalis TaxID=3241599 RepID=UPI003555BE63
MAGAHRFAASVIIPTYQRRDMLVANLRSLLASDMAPDAFEIIVADDGSSDGSFEAVREISQAETGTRQIRYVHQQDEGYRTGRARNLGIALAEGEVCIFLDCGIVVSQGFVRGHVEAHAEPNRVVLGYLYGFTNTGDNGEALAHVLDESLDLADVDATLARLRALGTYPDMREPIYAGCGDRLADLPAPWAIGWGGNISVRRETLGERIRFDEAYRTWGAEDIDFSLALHEAGATFALARAGAGIHLPHPKSHEVNARSSRPNKIYLNEKFKRPETALLIDVQSWDLNDALMRGERAATG